MTNWFTELTGNAETTMNLKIYCEDLAGNYGLNDTIWFTYDSTPPGITISSPTNTSYSSTFDLNMTTDENADQCLYNLNGGSNTSLSNDSMTNWFVEVTPGSDATHQLNIYCNDTLGNMGLNDTVWFTYDNTPPTLLWSSPSASNGTEEEEQTTINWRFNVSEFVGTFCKFEINGTNHTGFIFDEAGTSYCTYQESGITTNVTHCAIGHADDQVGNVNSTDVTVCRDTNIPDSGSSIVVTITNPTSGSYTQRLFDINATTDVAADTCQYMVGPSGTNITMTNSSTTNWFSSSQAEIIGDQPVYVYCQNGSVWNVSSVNINAIYGGGSGGGGYIPPSDTNESVTFILDPHEFDITVSPLFEYYEKVTIMPLETGNMYFSICSDDESEEWVSFVYNDRNYNDFSVYAIENESITVYLKINIPRYIESRVYNFEVAVTLNEFIDTVFVDLSSKDDYEFLEDILVNFDNFRSREIFTFPEDGWLSGFIITGENTIIIVVLVAILSSFIIVIMKKKRNSYNKTPENYLNR